VARAAARSPRFAAVDRAVGEKGGRIVFLLRLSPLIPYVLSNYFYGITSVPFTHYVLASWVGMLPLTFLYASLGAAARRAAGAPAAGMGRPGAVDRVRGRRRDHAGGGGVREEAGEAGDRISGPAGWIVVGAAPVAAPPNATDAADVAS
jgi:hypothetical protein